MTLLAAATGEHLLENRFSGTGPRPWQKLADRVGPTGKVFGIDISENMLAHTQDPSAQQRIDGSGVPSIVAMREKPSLRRWLAGWDIHVLHPGNSLTHPIFPKCLAECQRVLRPNGRIVVVAVSKEGKEGFHHACVRVDASPSPQPDGTADQSMFRRALEAAGFVIEESLSETMWVPVEIVRGRRRTAPFELGLDWTRPAEGS